MADIPDFTEIFRREIDREVAGNKPLLLDDPDAIWLVTSGRVDVFATTLENGELSGPRTYILSVEPGQVMFGMRSAAEERWAFVGVGTSEARVSQLTRADLERHLDDPRIVSQAAKRIDRWIDRLSETVAGRQATKNVYLL